MYGQRQRFGVNNGQLLSISLMTAALCLPLVEGKVEMSSYGIRTRKRTRAAWIAMNKFGKAPPSRFRSPACGVRADSDPLSPPRIVDLDLASVGGRSPPGIYFHSYLRLKTSVKSLPDCLG